MSKYIYGDNSTKEILSVCDVQLSADAKGYRTEIVVADNHAIVTDKSPKFNWKINDAGTDVELRLIPLASNVTTVLQSPNGTNYGLQVDDAGILETKAI
jgi:hypothetical protein